MNEKRRIPWFTVVIGVLLVISSVAVVVMCFVAELFPLKYVMFLGIAYLVLFLILALLMYLRRSKTFLRWIGVLLSVVLIVANCIGIYYIFDTLNFIDRVSGENHDIENYYLVVDAASDYEDILDLTNERVAYASSEFSDTPQALTLLREKLIFEEVDKSNFYELPNELFTGNVEGLFLREADFVLLNEIDETFEEKTRILETFVVKTEKTADSTKAVEVTEEPFILYISGNDRYGDITTISRSDVNIVMVVNPQTFEILLITIPRDYYVQLHDTDGLRDKLTHAGIYGVDQSVHTIEDLLDIEINYYIRVNFDTLIDLVDTIGGVTVVSDYAFTSSLAAGPKQYNFVEGENELNGVQALAFCRERKSLPHGYGERGRGMNQERVLTAIIKKMTSSEVILKDYTEILDDLEDGFRTNMSSEEITKFVRYQLDTGGDWNIESIHLDGSDSNAETYSMPGQILYVMEPDPDTIDYARQLIDKVLAGESNVVE